MDNSTLDTYNQALCNEQNSLFKHFDKDKKGRVTLDDIANGLNDAVEEHIALEDVINKFKEIDVEGRGSLDIEQFGKLFETNKVN